jgi:hypothetical protein
MSRVVERRIVRSNDRPAAIALLPLHFFSVLSSSPTSLGMVAKSFDLSRK